MQASTFVAPHCPAGFTQIEFWQLPEQHCEAPEHDAPSAASVQPGGAEAESECFDEQPAASAAASHSAMANLDRNMTLVSRDAPVLQTAARRLTECAKNSTFLLGARRVRLYAKCVHGSPFTVGGSP